MANSTDDLGSRLLKAVQLIVISPEDATEMARKYVAQSKAKFPGDSESDHQVRAADKIVRRYSKIAMVVGGASGLPSVIPGIGTAVSMVAGGTADSIACLKLQVDMCMCLASVFKYDVTSEDGKHLSFLIAATGSAQRAAGGAGTKLGSKAGVKLLQQHLRGPALQAVKEAFKRVGITFTRKAVERAIPFGIGAVVGGAANLAFTRFVGRQAKQWFIKDRDG